ncbi:MAG: hypothetical protein ACFFAT_21645 [Promethearchaeota archaeon]
MANEMFWSIIKRYNALMNFAIEGPNCIDPNICRGDCCSIKIDVPKVLAKKYIKRGYATKEDFIRSDIFSFQLRFDEETGKCFLFDKEINGCRVHNSEIKPPQCWIYPTNFSNLENKEINCKRANGWKIANSTKTLAAEKLLKKYIFLCQLEARKELGMINERIGKNHTKRAKKLIKVLKKKIKETSPSQLGGFKDTWDSFEILPAEGLSLQMKNFCFLNNKECQYQSADFLECKNICDRIADGLIHFLHHRLFDFVKKEGPDSNGEYPLYKLFKFNR